MRSASLTMLALAVTALPAVGAPPRDLHREPDAFDRLFSGFVIRDWISFARDEHERLENMQQIVSPRFVFVMRNIDAGPALVATTSHLTAWDVLSSYEGVGVLIPDPVHGECSRLPLIGVTPVLGRVRPGQPGDWAARAASLVN
ncbi:MAG: hypothetical protein H6810_12295 [Phycisphaeraceae bacterium]|nr:MAG: hypothetical protein H6810_12295 [Phycisphaeraceae bacterium]